MIKEILKALWKDKFAKIAVIVLGFIYVMLLSTFFVTFVFATKHQ